MFELLPTSRKNIITIKAKGIITEDDFEMLVATLEEQFTDAHRRRLLLDWEDLEGWAKGARSLGTWFGIHHRSNVERIAIVAADTWHDEVMRIEDVYKAAKVRRFDPARRDDAVEWLAED